MILGRPLLFGAVFAIAAAIANGGHALARTNSQSGQLDYSDYLTPQANFDWILQCQGCHGLNGEGMAHRDVPVLTNEVSKFLLVEGGREFLVRVPGVSGSPLSNERLADVLNWMLVSFDPSHLNEEWHTYSADEVKTLRRRPLRTQIQSQRKKIMANIEKFLSSTQGATTPP